MPDGALRASPHTIRNFSPPNSHQNLRTWNRYRRFCTRNVTTFRLHLAEALGPRSLGSSPFHMRSSTLRDSRRVFSPAPVTFTQRRGLPPRSGDRYTKAVLTAISLVLVWLSLGGPAVLPAVTAQQNAVGGFEYLTATPYYTPYREGQRVGTLTAYRACAAQATGWTCRQFEAPATLALSQRRSGAGPFELCWRLSGAKGGSSSPL